MFGIMLFGLLMIFSAVKINSVYKAVKHGGAFSRGCSLICDITVSLLSFFLLLQFPAIICICNNDSGYFTVYAEKQGLTDSPDILIFYSPDCRIIKKVEMNKRGRLNVGGDNEIISVKYDNNTFYFDYSGNETKNAALSDYPATKIYSPFSEYPEISIEKNFFGYEYISVKNSRGEQRVCIDGDFYLRKLIDALLLSTAVFLLLRNMQHILKYFQGIA